jgi:hypothetical protein
VYLELRCRGAERRQRRHTGHPPRSPVQVGTGVNIAEGELYDVPAEVWRDVLKSVDDPLPRLGIDGLEVPPSTFETV